MADNGAEPTRVPVLMDRRSTGAVGTRTQAILDAVRKRLDERRGLFDAAEDLGAVCIEVKMHAGTAVVKSVIITEEHINRRLPYR